MVTGKSREIKGDEILFIFNWANELTWCPSQCFRQFICPVTKKKMILYCRWRDDDPWEFSIYEHNDSMLPWTVLGEGLSSDDSLRRICKYAEELLYNYYEKRHNKSFQRTTKASA